MLQLAMTGVEWKLLHLNKPDQYEEIIAEAAETVELHKEITDIKKTL